jgi:hypothetical protein
MINGAYIIVDDRLNDHTRSMQLLLEFGPYMDSTVKFISIAPTRKMYTKISCDRRSTYPRK